MTNKNNFKTQTPNPPNIFSLKIKHDFILPTILQYLSTTNKIIPRFQPLIFSLKSITISSNVFRIQLHTRDDRSNNQYGIQSCKFIVIPDVRFPRQIALSRIPRSREYIHVYMDIQVRTDIERATRYIISPLRLVSGSRGFGP